MKSHSNVCKDRSYNYSIKLIKTINACGWIAQQLQNARDLGLIISLGESAELDFIRCLEKYTIESRWTYENKLR